MASSRARGRGRRSRRRSPARRRREPGALEAAPAASPGRPGCRCRRRGTTARSSLATLSESTTTPPGARTRASSAKRRSWSSAVGTWCSIVNDTAPVNRSSSSGSAVASASITSTFEPSIRAASLRGQVGIELDRGQARRPAVRSTSVVMPGPGPTSMTSAPSSTSCQGPGQDLGLDDLAPLVAGAQLQVHFVHAPTVRRSAVASSTYPDNRCRRSATPTRRSHRGGAMRSRSGRSRSRAATGSSATSTREDQLAWTASGRADRVDGREHLGAAAHARALDPGRVCRTPSTSRSPRGCTASTSRPTRAGLDRDDPTVVSVSPLLGELIVHLAEPRSEPAARRRAEALVFDLLEPVTVAPLRTPWPEDERARSRRRTRITDEPGDDAQPRRVGPDRRRERAHPQPALRRARPG